MDNIDFETLTNMFNSSDKEDVNVAEGIFINFTNEEIKEYWEWGWEWGWKEGFSLPYVPTPKINERVWKRITNTDYQQLKHK